VAHFGGDSCFNGQHCVVLQSFKICGPGSRRVSLPPLESSGRSVGAHECALPYHHPPNDQSITHRRTASRNIGVYVPTLSSLYSMIVSTQEARTPCPLLRTRVSPRVSLTHGLFLVGYHRALWGHTAATADNRGRPLVYLVESFVLMTKVLRSPAQSEAHRASNGIGIPAPDRASPRSILVGPTHHVCFRFAPCSSIGVKRTKCFLDNLSRDHLG